MLVKAGECRLVSWQASCCKMRRSANGRAAGQMGRDDQAVSAIKAPGVIPVSEEPWSPRELKIGVLLVKPKQRLSLGAASPTRWRVDHTASRRPILVRSRECRRRVAVAMTSPCADQC